MRPHLVVLALAGCATSVASAPNDAATDTPPAVTCKAGAPFGTPVLVAGVSSASSDPYAWLSSDELTIFFTSDRPGSDDYDVYTATRTSADAAFDAASRMANVSTTDGDLRPSLTFDGLTMFAFVTLNAGQSTEIVQASRPSRSAEFGPFTTLTAINSPVEDEDPYVDAAGLSLYFTSARGGTPDLYRATRPSTVSQFDAPVAIGELNTPATENVPVASDDGLELFFSSDRAGGAGGLDIWRAQRTTTSDGFGAATPVLQLNTASEDWPVWVSSDQCRLYFVSTNRAGGPGGRDVWVATRSKLP